MVTTSPPPTCITCRHSEGGYKRDCDGRALFCQKPASKKYLLVVHRNDSCRHYEREPGSDDA